MQDKQPSGLQVVKKDEKEPRVKAFIERHIKAREAAGSEGPCEYLLVARSPESPVCRALSALAPLLHANEISIRIVFSAADTGAFQGDSGASADLLQMATTRIVSDARLYEAHEQLVLGTETCWIGDCMRREPAKRDAYESYRVSCAVTARSAAMAFSKLWRLGSPSVPVSRFMPSMGFKDAHDQGVATHAFPESDSNMPTALTRH